MHVYVTKFTKAIWETNVYGECHDTHNYINIDRINHMTILLFLYWKGSWNGGSMGHAIPHVNHSVPNVF